MAEVFYELSCFTRGLWNLKRALVTALLTQASHQCDTRFLQVMAHTSAILPDECVKTASQLVARQEIKATRMRSASSGPLTE